MSVQIAASYTSKQGIFLSFFYLQFCVCLQTGSDLTVQLAQNNLRAHLCFYCVSGLLPVISPDSPADNLLCINRLFFKWCIEYLEKENHHCVVLILSDFKSVCCISL